MPFNLKCGPFSTTEKRLAMTQTFHRISADDFSFFLLCRIRGQRHEMLFACCQARKWRPAKKRRGWRRSESKREHSIDP